MRRSLDVYMPTKNTPVYPFWREETQVAVGGKSDTKNDYFGYLEKSFQQLKRMTALSRLVLRDVNITASEHQLLLHANGLQEMLNAGAECGEDVLGTAVDAHVQSGGGEETG